MKSNRKYRLARTSLGLSMLILLGSAATSISTAADKEVSEPSNFTQVVVVSGESLWSIAQMVADSGSINEVIAQIVEVNQLTSADVSAGMKLLVPVK